MIGARTLYANLAIRRVNLTINADFEDDVIVAAAQTAGMDFLVTNSKTLLAKSIVPALSSEDILAHLKSM